MIKKLDMLAPSVVNADPFEYIFELESKINEIIDQLNKEGDKE